MARRVPHRVIFDPRGLIGGTADVTHRRLTSTTTLPIALEDMIDADVRQITIHPHDERLADQFLATLRAIKIFVSDPEAPPLAFLIDEAAFFDLQSDAFQWLAKCTSRDRLHLILTAHRPLDVPTTIRAITDHWCIFPTSQDHDLRAIEARTSPQVSAWARRLKTREYVHWDDAKAVCQTYTDARVWFVPLTTTERHAIAITPEASITDVVHDYLLEPTL
jgi:hypothetical protein